MMKAYRPGAKLLRSAAETWNRLLKFTIAKLVGCILADHKMTEAMFSTSWQVGCCPRFWFSIKRNPSSRLSQVCKPTKKILRPAASNGISSVETWFDWDERLQHLYELQIEIGRRSLPKQKTQTSLICKALELINPEKDLKATNTTQHHRFECQTIVASQAITRRSHHLGIWVKQQILKQKLQKMWPQPTCK